MYLSKLYLSFEQRWVYGICAITGCSISFFCFVLFVWLVPPLLLLHRLT